MHKFIEIKILELLTLFSEIGGTDAQIGFQKPAFTKLSASGAVGLRSCRPLRIADNGYDVVCLEIVGVVVTITDEKASVSLYMLKGLRFT